MVYKNSSYFVRKLKIIKNNRSKYYLKMNLILVFKYRKNYYSDTLKMILKKYLMIFLVIQLKIQDTTSERYNNHGHSNFKQDRTTV